MKKTDSTPLRDKVAYLGVFLALALICSYVESLIPFYFGIPGVKLGLTNIVVVLMLYCVGTKEAFAISMLRIVLAGFLCRRNVQLSGDVSFETDRKARCAAGQCRGRNVA